MQYKPYLWKCGINFARETLIPTSLHKPMKKRRLVPVSVTPAKGTKVGSDSLEMIRIDNASFNDLIVAEKSCLWSLRNWRILYATRTRVPQICFSFFKTKVSSSHTRTEYIEEPWEDWKSSQSRCESSSLLDGRHGHELDKMNCEWYTYSEWAMVRTEREHTHISNQKKYG